MTGIAFHEKAGRSQGGSFLFSWDKVFSPAECHCRHPSIRTLDERSFRSVQVGYSRFSRCCQLIIDLSFHLKDRSWARRLTQSPELGVLAFDFPFPEMFLFLCCDRQRTLRAVVQRFVHFSAYPQVMQQHCQLACRGDDGSFLPVPASTLGQLQTPAPQIAVRAKRAENVLCTLHQKRSQIGIALLADVHLGLALARVPASWLQAQVATRLRWRVRCGKLWCGGDSKSSCTSGWEAMGD